MMHMPYVRESNREGSGYGTNQSLPSNCKSHGILHPARGTAGRRS